MVDVRTRRPTSLTAPNADAQPATAGSPADVDAALVRFQRQQGIGVRLDDGQARVLSSILAGPDGSNRGQVYIALAAGGVGLVPGSTPGSQERFNAILDAAVQVFDGRNLGPRIRGGSPLERIESYASIITTVAAGRGGITDESVAIIRRNALDQPNQQSGDVFETGRGAGRLPVTDGGAAVRGPVIARPEDTAVNRPAHQSLDLAGLRSAAQGGDFEAARKNLEAAQKILRENPNAVSKEELAQYVNELESVKSLATDEDDMDFWDILLAVLTLGISLLVDYLHDSEHEKVMKLTESVQARIDQIAHDPDGSILGSVFGHGVPARRVPGEKIPGTDVEWTPANVAQILDDAMDGRPLGIGTQNESQLLDITHALHIDDRIAVAEAYWARKGEKLTGRAALDALYDKMVSELDDNPFWQTRDGLVIRAQLDPANPTGQLQPHDMIMLDLKGVFSQNGAAIQRLLMRCDAAQLRSIDLAMRERYGTSLEDAVKGLQGADERRALFLLRAPRVDGEVPESYVRAYELREAVRGFGTNETQVFQLLASMSHDDFMETAAAYYELTHDRQGPVLGATVQIDGVTVRYGEAQRLLAAERDPARREMIANALRSVPTTTIPKLWDDDVEGDGGQSGQVRATALYRRLFDDLNDKIGGDDRWLERLALASEGLAFEPDPSWTPDQLRAADSAHRERVARYVAVSIRLAGDNKMDEQDLVGTLGLIAADTPPGQVPALDGRPNASQVRSSYTQQYGTRNMRVDINGVTNGEVRQLANLVLDGEGYDSPAAAALRLHNAMDSGALGLRGTREEVVYEILDRPDLSAGERAQYLTDVKREYQARFGKDLRAELVDTFGAELELPDGRTIDSRVVRLVDNGVLTPGEQLVYAMHEKGAFGIFGKTEGDVIMRTLGELSPLEKVVAMSEYGRIMGQPFNPEDPSSNALLRDLRELRSRDARRAEQLALVMPGDVNAIAFEVAAFLNKETDPVVSAWLRENLGDPDEWIARNFADEDPRRPGVQSSGLEGLRELVNVAGGPGEFAVHVSMPEEQFVETVRAMVVDSRGNGMSEMLMDFFGPEGAGLEVYARKVGAAVRDAEIYRQEHGEITDEHAERIQQHYTELLVRVSEYDQLKDARVETASNIALTIAVAGTLIAAPEISPAVLMGIGAVTKTGTHMAFGERDAVFLLQQAVRGGATGLIAHFGAAQMAALPPEVSLWAKALQGGITGAETSVMNGAVYRATDGRTWHHGVVRGGQTLVEGAFHDAPVGFASGVAVTVATHYAQRAWDSLFGRDNPVVNPEDLPPDPGPGDVDPTDPVTPTPGDGPGRPGSPGGTEPVPGGPGRPGSPGGTTPVPGGPGRPGSPGGTTPGGSPGGTTPVPGGPGRGPTTPGGGTSPGGTSPTPGGGTSPTPGGGPGRGPTSPTPGAGATPATPSTPVPGGPGRGPIATPGQPVAPVDPGRVPRASIPRSGTPGGGAPTPPVSGPGRGVPPTPGAGAGPTTTPSAPGVTPRAPMATANQPLSPVTSSPVAPTPVRPVVTPSQPATPLPTGAGPSVGPGRGAPVTSPTPGAGAPPASPATSRPAAPRATPSRPVSIDGGDLSPAVARRSAFARSLTSASAGSSAPGGTPTSGIPGANPGPGAPQGNPGSSPGVPFVSTPGEPREVRALGIGWQDAVRGSAPVGTLQVLLGAEAYQWSTEIARRGGTTPSDEAWQSLIDRARHAGIPVPTEIPRTPAAAQRTLEAVRAGSMAAAGGSPSEAPPRTPATSPVPERRPGAPATAPRSSAPEPTAERPAAPAAERRATPAAERGSAPAAAPRSSAPAPTAARPATPAAARPATPAAGAAETAELERIEAEERATTARARGDALAAQPAFAGSDRAWIEAHGAEAAAFMTGRPRGSLAGATPEQIIAAISTAPEGVNDAMEGTLFERTTRAQQGLQSFGLSRNADAIDGIPGPRTRAALDNAVAIFGPVFGGNREGVVNSVRSFGGVMEYAARATGRDGTPGGASLGDLRSIVDDYRRVLIQSGHLDAAAAGQPGTFNHAVLEAHKAYKAERTEQERIGAERQAVRERLDAATSRYQTALQGLSGTVREEDVLDVLEAFGALEQMQRDGVQGANSALNTARNGLASALDSPQKVATFLSYSGGLASEGVGTVITERIVARYTNDQLSTLGTALASADVGRRGVLDGVPIAILDRADDAMAAVNPMRGRVQEAVLRRKDVQRLISEDFDYLLNSAPADTVGRRLAELDPGRDANALTSITNVLVRRANSSDRNQRGVAELILEVADHNPAVASAMLRQMYAGLDWEEKDDFAMALSQPRDGHRHAVRLVEKERSYDDAIEGLASDVKETMANNLYRDLGWYVYNDAERAFAYFLRGEDTQTDRFGRHR